MGSRRCLIRLLLAVSYPLSSGVDQGAYADYFWLYRVHGFADWEKAGDGPLWQFQGADFCHCEGEEELVH